MHGTFRAHITDGTAVSFAAELPVAAHRRWRPMLAVLLAGCAVVVLSGGPRTAPTAAPEPILVKPKFVSRLGEALTPAVERATNHRRDDNSRPAKSARPRVIKITLPEPTPVRLDIPAPPKPSLADASPPRDLTALIRPAPRQVATADVPPAPVAPSRSAEQLRAVDIVQISESDVTALRVPQLNEPGLAAGAPALSARIAAMQVTPPPPARLRESERAALLAEAPTRLTVRIGETSLGQVDFRMSETQSIDIKLGNLLDLLAAQYDAAEFARLRASGAADAYVGFDQLRALGLNVRYDPVYDEVRVSI